MRELLELADVEAHSCSRCGWHESMTNDLSLPFGPENSLCRLCAGMDRWDRMLEADDRAWARKNENAPASMPRPSDGRGRTHMTLLSPEEAERRRGGGSGHTH